MKNRTTPERIKILFRNEIFVFGSNEAGIHGAGAAKAARKFGAKIGIGAGLSGNTYAIPTKDMQIKTLPLSVIKYCVSEFEWFAYSRPDLIFLVTPIGCGLAGYMAKDIAPLFCGCTELNNVWLPKSFWECLQN